jgi:hypothetical protein
MPGGGTDLNLAASAASSATSGVQGSTGSSYYGDFIVGSGSRKTEGLSTWVIVSAIGAAVVILTIFLVRK